MNLIYHFDPITKLYINSSELELDPIKKEPLIPAHATQDAPPTPGDKQAVRRAGDAWEIIPDYRGYKGFDAKGVAQTITEVAITPDPTWALSPPPLTKTELEEIDNLKEEASIRQLEMDSISEILAWIATQPNAPQQLKDKGAQVIAAKGRMTRKVLPRP